MPLVKMSEILNQVQDKSYAIGAFNVSNMEMVMGAVKAAEEMQAPLILQVAEGRLRYSPLELIGFIMVAAAKKCSMPTAVQLDHGATIQSIQLALELGFSSVMFDGSKYPLEENIVKTKKVKMLANQFQASVEGEIGNIGGSESDDPDHDICITRTADAVRFAKETQVDALAIAIGTAHGNYRFQPNLRIDRLKEIAHAVKTPLVLHGGTGLTASDFCNCFHNGIRKINIATASYDSVASSFKSICKKKPNANYFDFSEAAVLGTYENVIKHMRIFKMENKAQRS